MNISGSRAVLGVFVTSVPVWVQKHNIQYILEPGNTCAARGIPIKAS